MPSENESKHIPDESWYLDSNLLPFTHAPLSHISFSLVFYYSVQRTELFFPLNSNFIIQQPTTGSVTEALLSLSSPLFIFPTSC